VNPDSDINQQPPTVLGELNRVLSGMLQVLAVIVMTCLVLDVVWGVFTRYALGEQAKWTEELARFLLIWVSLLGGAVAYRNREHLGIDFLVTKLDSSVYDGTKLFTEILSCVVVFVVLIVGGIQLVASSLSLGRPTPALGWQMGFVYLVIPITGVLMFLFSLEFIVTLWNSDADTSAANEE